MRIRVLSDLHREFGPVDLPDVAADVVMLGGDIGRGTKGVARARQKFPDVRCSTLPAITSTTMNASDDYTRN
jgi:hypothetical protein